MKCPSCGGNMGLEDAVCPYCGQPNTQAVQHQSDMARYQREYERTQAEVLEETSFMRGHGSWLVILAALLVALIAAIALNVSAWDIGYSIREGNVDRTFAESAQTLDAYLEQGDYGKFLGYYEANDLSLANDTRYQAMQTAARAYVDLLTYISAIGNSSEYAFTPNRIADTSSYIASDLNTIYGIERYYDYDLERYLPESMKPYLDDLRERTAFICVAYFGLTDEQVQEIPNMSEKKLAQLIEEGVSA